MMLDIPLMTYVASLSVTPGPNNLMLAASGVNFGFRRTLPHMLGISIGHAVQVALVALALSWIMQWLEAVRLPLMVVGCSYLLWLAWKQAHADRPDHRGSQQPLGFLGAAAFQWVNPKAWMMVLNVAILFLPADSHAGDALLLGLFCAVVNFPCIALWAWTGDALRQWMHQPWVLRSFNYSMALLLAVTAVYLLVDEWRHVMA